MNILSAINVGQTAAIPAECQIESRGQARVSTAAASAKLSTPSTPNLTAGVNPQSNVNFEWLAVDWLIDYADAGENVARYIKHERRGSAPGWGAVIEARDVSGKPGAIQALEIDICSDRNETSPLPHARVLGLSLYYGAQTDTFEQGPQTLTDTAIRVWPIVFGRNRAVYGINYEGTFIEGAVTVGHHPDSETRHAVSMGPGVTLKFSSGTGKAHPSAWHSLDREFSVTDFPVVGLIDIEVDGTTLQIPVFRKTIK